MTLFVGKIRIISPNYLSMNQGPIAESFSRDRQQESMGENTTKLETDVEATFMYAWQIIYI